VTDYWDLSFAVVFSIVDYVYTYSPMADIWLGELHSGLIFVKLSLLVVNVNFMELISSWCWSISSIP
jgi:hypothetical protein